MEQETLTQALGIDENRTQELLEKIKELIESNEGPEPKVSDKLTEIFLDTDLSEIERILVSYVIGASVTTSKTQPFIVKVI